MIAISKILSWLIQELFILNNSLFIRLKMKNSDCIYIIHYELYKSIN